MTVFPRFLLDSDDDWIEVVRGRLYPWLHPRLRTVSDATGVPLFATSTVDEDQYVGKLDEPEEVVEEELEELASVRNPIAAYKEHASKDYESTGSWVILHADAPEIVEEGMQLHLTLLPRFDGEPGVRVYAHYEDDWRPSLRKALAHLRGSHFHVQQGVNKARWFLDRSAFLVLKDV